MPPILVVTGASGGIGAATTRLAAQRGITVCVNYLRNKDAAEELAYSIQGIAVQADISSETEVVRLFETVDRKLGRVTALVNNAATLERQIRSTRWTPLV
jgi:NAD(P)-dependent dehydrogenase (short-subunit alcohol dehydrogenase family)